MSTPFDSLFAPWWGSHVAYEDDALLVVDKPWGVSAQGSEPGIAGSALHRVRTWLAARDAVPIERVTLAMHRGLERDASGALAITRTKESARALVASYDLHAVHRTFRAQVTSSRDPTKTRRWVEETTHEPNTTTLRQRLAARGTPVVGDTQHGGEPAARLMLHASEIVLPHPVHGRELRVRSPWPEVRALDSVLRESASRRWGLVGADHDAFRLVNDAGDEVPGVTVDRYGEHLLVQFYDVTDGPERERVLDAVSSLGARGVYVKNRPRQSNTLVDTRREDLAPARAVRGENAPASFVVRESGVQYEVHLGDGLSTGIFLDQRENRAQVRALSAGRTVLNLFAYTCPFTVAAAVGGARGTMSVDVSAGALAWGRRNLALNGFDTPEHATVTADVFGWLEAARARGDRFDLVILDPPSYSTTKDGSRFSAASDYRDLARRAFTVLAPGGQLLACSNHRGTLRVKLRRYLYEAAALASRTVQRMRDLADAADFPPVPGNEAHLKSLLVVCE